MTRMTYREFGDFINPLVIRDGSNDNSNFPSPSLLLHEPSESSNGDWGSVNFGHEETLEDDFIELGRSSAGKETVEFHQQTEIDILRPRLSTPNLPVPLMTNIHSL